MSHFGTFDWYTEVQKGNVAGHSLVHKFGRNDAVPNGSWAFINVLGFTAWPLSVATTVRIKAGGNVADTAGGAGAQSITVEGCDGAGVSISETIVTAGASASAVTTATFLRVYRAYVSPASAGTYGGSNTGIITIENGAGGTDLLQIAAGEGQSQFGGYTIPAGKTGYLLSAFLTVDGSKAANIRMYTRADATDASTPFEPTRLKLYWNGILGKLDYKPVSPSGGITEKSDIWFEALGAGNTTEVSVDFELLLIDN